MVGEHLKFLSKNLALQSSKYGRFVFIGDFNFIGDLMENEAMKDLYGLTSLNGNIYIYIYYLYILFFIFYFFILLIYLGFLSRPFTNRMTVGEGERHFFKSSPPLRPASQTPRH